MLFVDLIMFFITIPETVKSIGEGAFAGCNIQKITIYILLKKYVQCQFQLVFLYLVGVNYLF